MRDFHASPPAEPDHTAGDLGGKSTALACGGKGETKLDTRITLIADRIADTKLSVDAVPMCTPKVFSK